MRRELYIDGRLADIDGVSIPLNFACSEIADLSGVSGNYSLTVKLPLTGNNILIAYFANLPNTSPAALWTGYKTTGSYFVDGVPIFQNADVRLLSSEKTIDVQITFGNLTWLDVLANIKLKDIVSEFFTGFQHNWNYWIVENENNAIRWIMTDWGGTFESGVHAERMHPAINVYNLWDAVWEKMNQLGVICKQPDFFPETDLWMPIMSQILNPALPVGAEFTMAVNLQLTDQVDSANVFDGFTEFEYTTPNTGIVFDNIKRYFIIPKDGLYRVQINSNIIITTTVIGYEGVSIDFQLKYRDGGLSESVFNGSWDHGSTGVETYPVVFDQQIKYKKGDIIYMDMICEQEGTPGYECRVELDASSPIFSIDYIPVLNKKDQLEFLMPYDIAYNMPDISCKDFVKAIMQLYGLLVENKNTAGNIENSPVMFNLDSLTGTTFENWSDKLVSFDRPKIEWSLGFKQRNYLRYLEDETDNIFEDAYFTTYETDNTEKDVFKSIFAATDDVSLIGTSYFPLPVCSIPQWIVDGETWKFEGKCKQRIVRAYQTGTTFEAEIVQLYNEGYTAVIVDETAYISYFKTIPSGVTDTGQGLDMASIMAKYYTGFIEAVISNRLFTFQFLLNQIDINKFTHITPVWIEKFSNFFFAKKVLNWEAGRVCNVEMLQLRDSGALGVHVPITAVKYGLLYNWPAATDARLICADGWHLMTYTEIYNIDLLENTYSDINRTNNIREVSLDYWQLIDSATNSLKFNARGAGWRAGESDGDFYQFQVRMYLLLDNGTASFDGYSSYQVACEDNSGFSFGSSKFGFSIRPVKNSTDLNHGESGTYQYNDGKVGRTICIDCGYGNKYEVLADNLCETKFRNGEWIPGFDGGVYTPFSNPEWAALTTAGVCCLNDDTDNI